MSPATSHDDAAMTRALERDRAARRLAQTEFERPVVLEAGAGTGKTTTLVARILAWCLGPGWERNGALLGERAAARGNPSPTAEQIAAATLQRVVAITFTEAAAAEMAGRVGLELASVAGGTAPVWLATDLLPDETERTRRARALAGTLDRLVVRTIHAFCRGLLADHPLEAGLHPELVVDADGRRAEQAAREAVTARLATAYGEPGDAAFLALATDGFGPEALATTLTELVSQGARPEDFDEDPVGAEQVAALRRRLAGAVAPASAAAAPLAAVNKRSTKTLAAVAALEATRRALETETSGAAPVETLELLCEEIRTSWDAAALDRLKEWARGTVNASESKLLDAPEDLIAAAASLAPLLRHVLDLAPRRLAHARRALVPLLAEVRRQLRTRGVLTFSDLLLEARDLLARRPGVRRRIQRGIDQLLVDEFQDTDDLQCELLRHLALEGAEDQRPALFLVGDPKQSIYGWRSADLAAYDAFLDEVRTAGGTVEILAENFRSVPAILDEVARSVAPVMIESRDLQPRFQPLVACAARADDEGFRHGPWAPVEHWVSWRSEVEDSAVKGGPSTRAADSVMLEAEALARDLLRLRREHGVAWSSVGLLLRSTGNLDDYLEALRRAGIPFAVGRDRHYYRRREIIEAAALVRAVVDPGDPVALLTVLRSPAVGVPDAALVPLWSRGFPRLVAELRLDELERVVGAAAAGMPAGVPGLDRLRDWPTALLAALTQLARLRASFHHDPADVFVEALRDGFIQEILESSRYLGRYRLANLDRFFRQLHQVLAEDGDVPGLLRMLRRSVAEAEDAEEARPRDADDEAVQVLTIHGAKGLDFEHVYLLQLHKRPPGGRRRDRPRLERRGGRVAYRLFEAPTLDFDRIEAEEAAVEAAERVRLLYVAMTRAKRRLVLAGGWSGHPKAAPAEECVTLLQLLAHRAPEEPALTDLFHQSGDPVERRDLDGIRWVFPGLELEGGEEEPLTEGSSPALAAIDEVRRQGARLAELQVQAQRRMQRPWRAAASAEAHRRLETLLDRDDDEPPAPPATGAVREPRERRVAQAVGTVVHRVLEELDLAADADRAWEEQLERLEVYAAGAADPELQAEVVEAAAGWLERLATGRLAERLRELAAVTAIAREVPVLLPPEEGETGADDGAPVGYVSGLVDLLYRDPDTGELVVADYKTDAIDQAGLAERTAAYRLQGEVYRRAVAQALGLTVAPRFELWYLYADRIVEALTAGPASEI